MLKLWIENKYGYIEGSYEDPGDKARLEWRGPGIEVYLVGTFTGLEYSAACNIANQAAIEAHIPLHSLRRVKAPYRPRGVETETKRMF